MSMQAALFIDDDEGDVTQWACSDADLSDQFEKELPENSNLEWWMQKGFRITDTSTVGALMVIVLETPELAMELK